MVLLPLLLYLWWEMVQTMSIFLIYIAYIIRYEYLIYNLTLCIVFLVKVLNRNYSVIRGSSPEPLQLVLRKETRY